MDILSIVEKYQNEWLMRKFIAIATGAGAALIFNPLSSWAINEIDPRS
jgi:hypothetical protein